MQRIVLALFIGALIISSNVQAAITEVLLFPNGAVISAESTLNIQNQQATFLLPNSAAPDSLQMVPLGPGKIINYQISSVISEETDLSELEKQLRAKQEVRRQLLDQQTIGKLGLAYWDNQKTQQLDRSQDIEILGNMIITASTPLVQNLSRLAAQLRDIDAEITELERQLAERRGHSLRLWQVTVQTTSQSPKALPIRYQYRTNAARWLSHYTLEAQPATDQVQWLWQAQLQQSSGEDWNNVELKIATSEPHINLTPPDVAPWVIRERNPAPIMLKQSMNARSEVAAMADSAVLMTPAPEAYERSEGELFDTYALGKQTIIAGQPTTLTIAEGQWTTHFSYLLRPQHSTQTFLTAALTAAEPVSLPSGQAALLVDGVLVGKSDFSFHGKQQTLFFGSDPAVVCKVSKEDLADRSGLFNKKRNLAWKMAVEVTNRKNLAIELNIEDAYPRVSDKRIELTALEDSDLQTGEHKDGILNWNRHIAPGQTIHLEYGYSISYPEDMHIIPGR